MNDFTNRGITFIELIIIVALVLILGMSSVAFYSRFFNQNAVANTVDQLIGELRKAQIYAMTGKNNTNWGVRYASNRMTLFSGYSYATRINGFDESFSVNSAISVTGITEVVFTRMTGTASATPTITVSGGGNIETVTVNAQGVVNR